MGIYNKVKWILGISLVFFLIIGTNLMDKYHFVQIKDSVVTIYEDRLIAKGLIFDFSLLVQEKKMAVALSDSDFFEDRNYAVNNKISTLVSEFLSTKLTDKEEKLFDKFQENLNELVKLESQVDEGLAENSTKLKDQLMLIDGNLQSLSEIQLAEGRRQLSLTKQTFELMETFTRMEIYFLIFLALIIQFIVIYKPSSDEA